MKRRFRANVLLCLNLRGWSVEDLGLAVWGPYGAGIDTPRRRMHRILQRASRGRKYITLQDLETIAAVLEIPPPILAYGSADEVRAALLNTLPELNGDQMEVRL